MEKEIKVNGAHLKVYDYISDPITDKEGNERKKITFKYDAKGETNFLLIKALMEKTSIELSIDNESFKAKKTSSRHSYQEPLDENSNISMHFELEEVIEGDTVYKDAQQLQSAAVGKILVNSITIQAVTELLVEKEIISWEELEDKIQKVHDRDMKKEMEGLLTLKYGEE